MKALPVFVLTVVALSSAAAQAETCQWKDGAGRTVISDQPPPGNARDVRCGGGSAGVAPAPAAPPAAAAKTTAEKDLDFKKRQQDGKEKSDKAAKDEMAAANRKENCENAQRQLQILESGQRMATVDAAGERRILEDSERQAEAERARRAVADNCK